MPRPAAQEPADEQPAAYDPALAEWGVAPEDDELEDGEDPGDPPPMPAELSEPPAAPSDELVALGPPPKDTLAAEKWAHSVLMQQAYEVMKSDKISETVRRKEVRTILRDAKGHVTDAARYDFMKMVERDKKDIENRKRGRAAATPVPATPPPAGALIIPIRRDG